MVTTSLTHKPEHTVTEKRARVEAAALQAMRAPTDKGQLRSFIGCVQLGMDAAALTTVLNQGDQGENLIPPSLILIPDIPDIPEVPWVPSGA